ncbi:DUF2155 domain-containing protein [Limobrevibacterium gyesilva]|uniref:DUF2155 domain-containing protein n=1 Tax=Limobrevibacterium gyesilva TaxID=2991712 RepID=A0AA41YM10_9PROT|nr:DUF2155 domain-containing protein [Limobrevibacterium gyesilva]MCW3474433.1 DUF2155 domain-containing protein [Limobrevibacterium gyesilva]
MKPRALAALIGLLAGPALAQMPTVQTPTVQPPAARVPPGWTPLGPVQTPLPSAPAQPAQAAPADPVGPAIQSQQLPVLQVPTKPDAAAIASPPPIIEWQPRGSAELQALDKVTARTTTLTGKVGDTLRFGSLSIVVRSCVARAPDQPLDSAAYLDITDAHAGAPGFHGWMLASEPSVSMLEHPVYDIRLTSCRP